MKNIKMAQQFVMYKNKVVDRTLRRSFMTSFLRNAQVAEVKELKSIIQRMYSMIKRPIMILDIGVGDARIPLLLSKLSLWNNIKVYVGIDNSILEIKKARRAVRKRNLGRKIKVLHFDAAHLNKRKNGFLLKYKYDMVLCTYFTAGNFKPDEIKIKIKKNGRIVPYPKSCLEPNKKFVKIFRSAYNLLKPKGVLILGSIYIDTDANRRRQEEFYGKCGMSVITNRKDSFTATLEGFWSQRFTKERIYKYFSWINKGNIQFLVLDAYNCVQMIVVHKQRGNLKTI